MERHEIKSRLDAKLDAWKRNLDSMRVKVDTSEGDEKAAYRDQVTALEKEHEELRLKVERAWESAADKADRDSALEDAEKSLDEWVKFTAKTRDAVEK